MPPHYCLTQQKDVDLSLWIRDTPVLHQTWWHPDFNPSESREPAGAGSDTLLPTACLPPFCKSDRTGHGHLLSTLKPAINGPPGPAATHSSQHASALAPPRTCVPSLCVSRCLLMHRHRMSPEGTFYSRRKIHSYRCGFSISS